MDPSTPSPLSFTANPTFPSAILGIFEALLISKQYVIAMGCALLEFFVESIYFPDVKEHWWVSNIGLMMVLLGEVIPKAAILTARRSFIHNIRVYYEEEHKLITHGIYRFMRHPSYCGFFICATGTQVIRCNPICIIAFSAITWQFFSNRIPYEELFLRQFFGPQYMGPGFLGIFPQFIK